MKFRNYLETINGIGIYPLISLLIFFIFFVGTIMYVMNADKKEMDEMKNIPLDENSN